ncbi:hypothetical protein Arad_10022 [Rhizobium rhizogenes K84]|uniref:Uncharacterized protein n=1 Tax=Rhizobium rhizogenes (strain K84 / ATCC BAA-868) TaxID=311403 RepID=B9JMI0_RHIR8|nr:hypothetical protein Arad_10022 [Rhizobium rhizogenes K84]
MVVNAGSCARFLELAELRRFGGGCDNTACSRPVMQTL